MFQEIPNYISLHDLDIDWDKFHSQIVKFTHKARDYTKETRFNLKTNNLSKSIEEQLNGTGMDANDYIHNIFLLVIECAKLIDDGPKEIFSNQDANFYISLLDDNDLNYIRIVLEKIENFSNKKFGFIKCTPLQGKRMYEFHIDPSKSVYHLPIITTIPDCFFMVDGTPYIMPDTKKLYRLKTDVIHSAFNLSRKRRLHLLLQPQNEEIIPDFLYSYENLHLCKNDLIEKAKNSLKEVSKNDAFFNYEFYQSVNYAINKLKNF